MLLSGKLSTVVSTSRVHFRNEYQLHMTSTATRLDKFSEETLCLMEKAIYMC